MPTKTETPPAVNPPAQAAPEQWDGTNLAGDVVEAGIEKNLPQYQDELRWAWRYAIARGWSQGEMATEWGVDNSVISRVFRGKYIHSQTKMVLAPPGIMLSRIRETRRIELEKSRKRADRVMTPTVRMIWALAHKISGRSAEGKAIPGQKRLMGFLFGESHLGKSEGLIWYREEFNHGKTIYVDLQGVAGVCEIYQVFAKALQLSPDDSLSKLKPRIQKAINSDTLIIADELHHITYAYKAKSSKLMVNALKSIKDRTGCAMLMCGTPVAREEIEDGHEARLMKQLERRAASRVLNLPGAVPVYDVRAIAEARGLPFPPLPEGPQIRMNEYGIATRPGRDKKGRKIRVNADTWEYLGKVAGDVGMGEAAEMLDDLAHHHYIEAIFTLIGDAQLYAAHQKRALTWDDVLAAYENMLSLREPNVI